MFASIGRGWISLSVNYPVLGVVPSKKMESPLVMVHKLFNYGLNCRMCCSQLDLMLLVNRLIVAVL